MTWPTVIVLNYFPPSTNNLFPNGKGKRRFISKEYEIWKEAAGWQLAQHRIKPIRGCKVELLFQLSPPKAVRYRDCSNYVKAPEDLLISHGILAGDDQRYVKRVISEWSDDEFTGVIITITPLGSARDDRADVLSEPGALR